MLQRSLQRKKSLPVCFVHIYYSLNFTEERETCFSIYICEKQWLTNLFMLMLSNALIILSFWSLEELKYFGCFPLFCRVPFIYLGHLLHWHLAWPTSSAGSPGQHMQVWVQAAGLMQWADCSGTGTVPHCILRLSYHCVIAAGYVFYFIAISRMRSRVECTH